MLVISGSLMSLASSPRRDSRSERSIWPSSTPTTQHLFMQSLKTFTIITMTNIFLWTKKSIGLSNLNLCAYVSEGKIHQNSENTQSHCIN